MDIKPIETFYDGHRFRSRLEARWAVFFDALGIKYQYEPEGFTMKYGMRYLPDFALLNIRRRVHKNEREAPVYVEVKGVTTYKDISIDDRVRMEEFAKHYPLLILGNIPQDSWDVMGTHWDDGLFSYEYIDGDNYPCFFFIHNGEPWIAGPDHDECDSIELTDKALAKARQARFEYGETPKPQKITLEDFLRWKTARNDDEILF